MKGQVIPFPDMEARIDKASEAVRWAMVHKIEGLPVAIFRLAGLLRARALLEGK